MSVEVYRTQCRATDRALRSGNINDVQSIDGSCLATVVNAQLLLPNTTLTIPNTTLTIQSDFLCPMTQLVPEDAVIFGRMLYEHESVEQIIRDSLTKFLPRSQRGSRCIKNPLNPSHIIYSCPGRDPIRNEHEIVNIINELVEDVSDEWYTQLREEVERTTNASPQGVRGNDGKSNALPVVIDVINDPSF